MLFILIVFLGLTSCKKEEQVLPERKVPIANDTSTVADSAVIPPTIEPFFTFMKVGNEWAYSHFIVSMFGDTVYTKDTIVYTLVSKDVLGKCEFSKKIIIDSNSNTYALNSQLFTEWWIKDSTLVSTPDITWLNSKTKANSKFYTPTYSGIVIAKIQHKLYNNTVTDCFKINAWIISGQDESYYTISPMYGILESGTWGNQASFTHCYPLVSTNFL